MKIAKGNRIISLILKVVVILSAGFGTWLSAYAGRETFMGGSSVFMFFTIQSNLAIALICLIVLGFLYLWIIRLFQKRKKIDRDV